MRLLIDANIILDVLQKREPHYRASSMIWKLCETEQMEGYVTALTIASIVYIMRRELTPDTVAEVVKELSLIFTIADLTNADIRRAAHMGRIDFEDALQSAAAERIHADVIITRNIRDYRQSKVMAMAPSDFIQI